MKKCGIYIIKNKINDKVYIGQSVDIMCRWYSHCYSAKTNRQDSYTKIHRAMNKLGVENFYIEILEECPYDKLNEQEIYWIKEYDSYVNGYNMTPGGEERRGEHNGHSTLTLNQVEEIRAAYNNHIPFREVYKKYKDTISKRGLQKVWHYETWKHVMPEVYTDENRQWHATYAKSNTDGNKNLGNNNVTRACSEEEVNEMRKLREKGLSYNKIAEKLNRSQGVVRKYCLFQESKHPNKSGLAIQVKNLETGLIFDSLSAAAKWCGASKNTISKYKNTEYHAGIVPTTNEPAHWITL